MSHERDFLVCTQERRRSHAELRGDVVTEQDRNGSTKKKRKRSRGSTDVPRATGKRSRVLKRPPAASPSKSDDGSSAAENASDQERREPLSEVSEEESDDDEEESADESESEEQ